MVYDLGGMERMREVREDGISYGGDERRCDGKMLGGDEGSKKGGEEEREGKR